MVVALDNLVNATVQKNDTVKRLVISNSSLSASLAERNTEVAGLLTVIANLSTGGGGGGDCGGGGGVSGNNVKAADAPWYPMGYCWSQGFKFCVGHCSSLYKKRKDGHNAHLAAKRGDIQG